MNDEPFFDLAMKVIAGQGTDAERTELDALLTREPKLRAEFERLQTDARIAKGALPLVEATQATTGEFPAYARGRLQTKVRQTLGSPAAEKEPDRGLSWELAEERYSLAEETQVKRRPERALAWGWRWFLGVATATAIVVLLLIPAIRTQPGTVVQLAMLDMTGGTRGSDTNEVQLLRQGWNVTTIDSFSELQLLHAWETNWPGGSKQAAVKIIYDRAAAELRVLGRKGGNQFAKTFPVESELAIALKQAQEFVREQTKP
jgi:hypothetical protein